MVNMVRPDLPKLKVPICLLVDDWTVGDVWQEEKDFDRSWEFINDFADLVEQYEIRGKISFIPYLSTYKSPNPLPLGRIDTGIKGLSPSRLRKFIQVAKERLLPVFDISPEVLTHTQALDLKTERLLPESEWSWSNWQDEETLTEYIARGLEVLKAVGITANGVTSGCDFGREIEGLYVRAMLIAQKEVNNIPLTWYFLHEEPERRHWSVNPSVQYLDREKAEAVVSIVSGCREYFFFESRGWDKATPENISKATDKYLTADGQAGRIAKLFNDRSCIVFHSHFQRLYGADDRYGFMILKEVLHRIDQVLGDRVIWMAPSALARYWATMKAYEVVTEPGQGQMRLQFRSPFDCPEFTIKIVLSEKVEISRISADGRELRRIPVSDSCLSFESWNQIGNEIFVCFNMRKNSVINVEF